MNFYEKRSVLEQSERLPFEHRERYRSTQIDRIEIDGIVLQGYFEYSFLEEKSYSTQPVRSIDGTIDDLDDYTTFLTPRLIIKYSMMQIEDYRALMKLLKSKNTFMVTCYDIVEDRRVTQEMYFAPPSMPIIYQQYLMALGIQEYSIELIGTNRFKAYKTEGTVVIRQFFNIPLGATIRDGVTIIDKYRDIEIDSNSMFSLSSNPIVRYRLGGIIGEAEIASLVLNYYPQDSNTKKNGSGEIITAEQRYFTKDTIAYIQWFYG